MADRIHIVGGGVIGLGAAVRFALEGCEVHLFADDSHFFPTSAVAAAFWSPYACSMTPEQERALSEPTFRFIEEHAADPEAGIEFRSAVKYFDDSVAFESRGLPWWEVLPVDLQAFTAEEVPEHLRRPGRVGPLEGGWRFRVPVVDMTRFMPWLRRRAERLGVRFHTERVQSLQSKADAAAVLNCAGGWATHLAEDPTMVGYQGVVLEVAGEPFGDELLFIEKDRGGATYIVPQRHRTVLGGTLVAKTAPGERWVPGDRRLWEASADEAADVWARCCELVGREPPVKPTAAHAGLRPRRIDAPPRIEADQLEGPDGQETPVIHNYGHGGAGITTFWGSAELAWELYRRRRDAQS